MRTAEDFEKQAREKNITFWLVHNCSICNYQCGYVFRDGRVAYDTGCYCTGGSDYKPGAWEDVADQYNMQHNPQVIAGMDEFWGFKAMPLMMAFTFWFWFDLGLNLMRGLPWYYFGTESKLDRMQGVWPLPWWFLKFLLMCVGVTLYFYGWRAVV